MASAPGAPSRLRPLDVGDLLDETFRLYRRHFWLLIGVGAVALLPTAAVSLAPASLSTLMITGAGNMTNAGGSIDAGGALAFCGSALFAWLVSIVANFLLFAAMTPAVSEARLGRPITVHAAYARALRRLGPIVGLVIVYSLVIGLLAITVIGIPVAIYLAVTWGFAFPVLLLEGKGIGRAISRSAELVRGSWWRVVGIGLLLLLLNTIAGVFFSIPSGVVSGLTMVLQLPGVLLVLVSALSLLLSAAGQILVGPILYCGWILLYYDLRVRKEGFDLELLAHEVERTIQPGGGDDLPHPSDDGPARPNDAELPRRAAD
jgi:hypothetical protein